MIVVTGATGALGGAVVDHLLARLPAEQVVAAVRDPARAGHLATLGVHVRRADYAEPATLPAAFAGAEQVLLVSSNDRDRDTVALHAAAIDAAGAAGVQRVLYTSHQGAAAANPFAPARVHHATEQLLAGSGLAWTSLRNGFYAHTLGWLLGPWRESGVVLVPADGPVSWTDRGDLAAAAAAVLTADAGHDGPLTLTAGEAPTFTGLAALAGEAVGRPVRCEVVGEESWVADQVAGGVPEGAARFSLGIFQGARDGFFAGTDPALARLLGRAPRAASEALLATPSG